ncbi:MAG: exosortase/archaeosortase family protein [Planctomycetia bacterium]|nr:exosortase/archaeosortase family protein [Planctomycetia bacterium]
MASGHRPGGGRGRNGVGGRPLHRQPDGSGWPDGDRGRDGLAGGGAGGAGPDRGAVARERPSQNRCQGGGPSLPSPLRGGVPARFRDARPLLLGGHRRGDGGCVPAGCGGLAGGQKWSLSGPNRPLVDGVQLRDRDPRLVTCRSSEGFTNVKSQRPPDLLSAVRPAVPPSIPRAEPSVRDPGPDGLRRRPEGSSPPEADPGLVEGLRRYCRQFARELEDPAQRGPWLVIVSLLSLLMYSYWPGLLNAQSAWNNPQYSHGWIVPVFSVILLFSWRRPIEPVASSARLAGLALLAGSFALRLFAARYRIVTIDMYTFVPAVAGVFLLAGGWSMFRWAWAPIVFLIFMYPLPDEATRYLLGPLQRLATIVSTYALQTMGIDAVREGNQILLGDLQLGVVDACSGLRMLTIFIALSVALVLIGDRDWWENIIIIASAIPIALLVNSIRITVTGLLYQIANSEIAEMVFHDLAGWFMMPMALAMLFFEQRVLLNLFVTEDRAPAVVRSQVLRVGVPLQPARPLRPATARFEPFRRR